MPTMILCDFIYTVIFQLCQQIDLDLIRKEKEQAVLHWHLSWRRSFIGILDITLTEVKQMPSVSRATHQHCPSRTLLWSGNSDKELIDPSAQWSVRCSKLSADWLIRTYKAQHWLVMFACERNNSLLSCKQFKSANRKIMWEDSSENFISFEYLVGPYSRVTSLGGSRLHRRGVRYWLDMLYWQSKERQNQRVQLTLARMPQSSRTITRYTIWLACHPPARHLIGSRATKLLPDWCIIRQV